MNNPCALPLLLACALGGCVPPASTRPASVTIGHLEDVPTTDPRAEFRQVAQILQVGTAEELMALSYELFGWSVTDGRADEDPEEFTYLRSALGVWLAEQRLSWGAACAGAEAGPECMFAGLIADPDRLVCETTCCTGRYDEMPDNLIFLTQVCFVPTPEGGRELRHISFATH